MPRLIDHLVIGTHDLDALAARFEALGFTVGARNRHPWGTENRIIQFADQTFLELITIGDAGMIPAHAPRQFSFGAFVRDALIRRAGLSMLVLKSEDAGGDAARFARDNICDFSPFKFARKARKPDGSETDVAFTLAFATSETMPEAGFFTCQQHFPENFWSKAAQTHENGALGISRVSMLAENPSDHHIFLSALTDQREIRASSAGIEMDLGSSLVESLTGLGFAMRYGYPAPATASPNFAGFGIRFKTFGKLESCAQKAGENITIHGNNRVIHANLGLQSAILLEKE